MGLTCIYSWAAEFRTEGGRWQPLTEASGVRSGTELTGEFARETLREHQADWLDLACGFGDPEPGTCPALRVTAWRGLLSDADDPRHAVTATGLHGMITVDPQTWDDYRPAPAQVQAPGLRALPPPGGDGPQPPPPRRPPGR
jgi:hypothetical protein